MTFNSSLLNQQINHAYSRIEEALELLEDSDTLDQVKDELSEALTILDTVLDADERMVYGDDDDDDGDTEDMGDYAEGYEDHYEDDNDDD